MTDSIYDIAISGATPAGLVAAIRARQLGLSVVIVDKHPTSQRRPCGGWLSPLAATVLSECGVDNAALGAVRYEGVRLRSWNLTAETTVASQDLSGWLVHCVPLDECLLSAAARAGAELRRGVATASLDISEHEARLTLSDGSAVCSRLVFCADGALSHTAHLARMTPAGSVNSGVHYIHAAMSAPLAAAPVFDVLLGDSRSRRIAVVVRVQDVVRVTLIAADVADLSGEVQALFQRLHEAGVLPEISGTPMLSGVAGAGVALDMDTHAGKRTLLIGDAGGFVASFSADESYPAMKSGWLAAETAQKALSADVLQDELSTYGAAWRQGLADYIRTPSADLSLLLPLVFKNDQMARRVAHAFLLGREF